MQLSQAMAHREVEETISTGLFQGFNSFLVESFSDGEFNWICEDQFDVGSSCLQRCGIDGLNLLFLILFCGIVLVRFIRKFPIKVNRTKHWGYVFVSSCAFIAGIGYIISGLWNFQETKDRFRLANFFLLRGLVWMFLAVSLNIQWTKLENILILIWWISFSVLVSLLNIKILVKKETVRIIDMLSWPVNLFLLFCSIRLLKKPHQENVNQGLEEPLVGKKRGNQTEFSKTGWLNQLTFSWINSLLSLGYSKPLLLEDIPPLESEDEALAAYQSFAHEFDQLTKKSLNSSPDRNLVLKTLLKCNKNPMIVIGFFAIFRTLSVVAAPVLLYAFVTYSAHEERNLHQGLVLVGFLVIVKVVESLSQRHWFFGARRFGMRMRSAVMVAVFHKLLKLSSSGRRNHSTGEIVNYIAVDAYRLGEFPWWLHTTWTLLLQLVLAVSVLFGVVGLGSLPGLVPLAICVLLNFPFAKMLQKCQSGFMVAQDERLKATSEVLNNMKIIKLQSWEEKFKSVIESLREIEFNWLSEAQIKKSYGTVLYWMSPMLVSSVVFAGCAILRSAPLNASTIFTILAILRVMSEPVRTLPEALSMLIQVKVSLDRLDVFLLEEELPEGGVKRIVFEHSVCSVRIHSGTFSWNLDTSSLTLKDLTLHIKQGQKVAICGPVGAGKSSLLHALLGEIPKISGDVEVLGSIAYVAQTAWIQSGTIRDNILFGKPMDIDRYKKAIKVSALDKDIDNFDHGDLTEIGQRGLNMSGGQKQRIQLARAVYGDADTYLLDDPFSAVDAHTAAILFHECVMAALEKKTVILVTHQVEFLTEVDRILVMVGGQITQSGTYEELLRSGTAFEQLVTAHQEAMTALESKRNRMQDESGKGDQMESKGFPLSEQMSQEEISNLNLSTVQLTEDEEMETHIGWKPYFDYIRTSRGYVQFASLLFNQVAFVILQILSTYWLALADKISYLGSSILIGVYAGISAFSCLFVYLRTLSAALLGLKASEAFFSSLMNSVFKAPMSFFDSTPVGRIFTRASSDLTVLDFDIPYALAFVLTGAIEVLSTLGIMAAVTWQVLVVAIPILLLANYVQGYYMASARALIRINGTTKAPVMSYAAETSLGVVSIRAFSAMDRFISNYLRLVDTDASLFFYTNAAMEWVLIRVEALQNLTVITSTLLLVLLPNAVAPGLAGFSLTYALTLTSAQVFLTRFHCNLANSIISVERIKQYIHIPSEPPAIVEDKRPPSSWPSEGRIDLQELKVKYRSNAPLVLKGITCTFKAGKRVGVVGRTGSGKTTLISALFRLVEPVSGRILVDSLDICSIGLKDLRMKLSIIPQEPALFRGSIRSNLDPLGLYSDHEIWKALEKCQLSTTVSALPHLLDSSVSDEGQNWSVGQRQLFCLGRVLLKRNKILVLDEATASIDSATDAILQRVIRKEISGCTVITVAHRVPTVTDSDMVMVLSYGKLIEYEKPSKLMETNSSFAKLVAEYWANCRRGSVQDLNHGTN